MMAWVLARRQWGLDAVAKVLASTSPEVENLVEVGTEAPFLQNSWNGEGVGGDQLLSQQLGPGAFDPLPGAGVPEI